VKYSFNWYRRAWQ